MKNFLLVIYDEDQSEADVSALSRLCDEFKIEKIDAETGALIAEAYKGEYDFAFEGTCYRVYQDEMPPAMMKLDEEPLYIGRFDEVSEQRCIDLGALCKIATSLKVSTNGIGQKSVEHHDMFKRFLGRDCALDWQSAKMLEDLILNDHQAIEGELNFLFDKRLLDERNR